MASGMSFMDALRVAAKTKEAPNGWFPSRAWPVERAESAPAPATSTKKRKMCEIEPPRLKPRTIPAVSTGPTSSSNTKLLVLPTIYSKPARSEAPELSRALTVDRSASPLKERSDAGPLVRACTSVSHAELSEAPNFSFSSLRPAASDCATVSEHQQSFPHKSSKNGSAVSSFNFQEAASDWVNAVASSLRGHCPAPPRAMKPVPGSYTASELKKAQDGKLYQPIQFQGPKHEKKPSLSEILQWESEIASCWNKKMQSPAKTTPLSVVIPESFSGPATAATATAESDKLLIDELLMEFGVAEVAKEPEQPSHEYEAPAQAEQAPQIEAHEATDAVPCQDQSQLEAMPFVPPPLVDVANVAAAAPSMFADFLATPAIPPCVTPGWGASAWEPAVPPTPSAVPPTPSAPASGFASLWSEALTDSFNVDLSNLGANGSLW
eukprot:TRINITY_DN4520_c0_g1_i1.p1 TRINITY_DN4520_c0_g1~~TRINITY_DN4520_c0_g1_i1.p1  ORF type:complete len:437 (+),score=45.78 TRINITY_DN4520_c0_g1_i1:192-1502(+)